LDQNFFKSEFLLKKKNYFFRKSVFYYFCILLLKFFLYLFLNKKSYLFIKINMPMAACRRTQSLRYPRSITSSNNNSTTSSPSQYGVQSNNSGSNGNLTRKNSRNFLRKSSRHKHGFFSYFLGNKHLSGHAIN
jgi:hypothetical protein